MNRQRFLRSASGSAPRWTWRAGLLLLVGFFAMPGCLLLSWTPWLTGEAMSSADLSGSSNVLGKIPTPRTAVTLEVLFVERPVNDPLLGSMLWDQVDQIGSMSPEDRAALEKIGFRVGRVGANPPQALQTLMGLATDLTELDKKRLVERRVILPSGAETEINVGMLQPEATIDLPGPEGLAPRTLANVRGVFRMKAKQLQDGWARIEFLPELHHGALVNRPVAIPGGWQLHTAQEIERLYRQKFAFDLNIGEMVLITAEGETGNSLGRHFFHSPEFTGTLPEPEGAAPRPDPTPSGIQRLLIVRLVDLNTAKSLYSE